MKSVKSKVLPVFAAILLMPSPAKSSETDYTKSLIYGNMSVGSQQTGMAYLDTIPSLGVKAAAHPTLKLFRAKKLDMKNFRSNLLMQSDRASVSLNAPTPLVNNLLSFVGTVMQRPQDGTLTSLLQFLSVAATRKINAELTYSAPLGKTGRLDSAVACHLHPASGSGKAYEMVASVRYSLEF